MRKQVVVDPLEDGITSRGGGGGDGGLPGSK